MTEPPNRRREAATLILATLAMVAFFGFIVLPRLERVRASKQKTAPDFVLPLIYGGGSQSRLKLSDLRGKAVLLDFWASWCVPCRQEIPVLDRIAKKFENELVVIGVNTGDDRAQAVGLLKTLGVGYASVEDEAGRTANAYGVTTLPTLVIINREGTIKFIGSRVMNERELQAELAELL